MRKLISSGVLAVLLSMLANTVFAGNVEECEALKDGASPGLYGLCIAYHNAGSARAQERILNNYNKKAGPGDPPMPGTGGVPCPCFTSEDLSNAGAAFACSVSSTGAGLDLALYEGGLFQFGTDDLGCFKYDLIAPAFIELPTDPEENQACRDIILEAIDRDFGAETCQEGG